MLKTVRQYNIHLPLFYNDGRRIEPEKFEQVETLVLERYGGFTSIRQETPLRGSWRGEERIYKFLRRESTLIHRMKPDDFVLRRGDETTLNFLWFDATKN